MRSSWHFGIKMLTFAPKSMVNHIKLLSRFKLPLNSYQRKISFRHTCKKFFLTFFYPFKLQFPLPHAPHHPILHFIHLRPAFSIYTAWKSKKNIITITTHTSAVYFYLQSGILCFWSGFLPPQKSLTPSQNMIKIHLITSRKICLKYIDCACFFL